jgi:polar amino acid transport system substrate-binding protein
MKKIISIVLALTLMVGCALSLTSCGVKGKTLAEVKEAGKLVVATSPDFPPFENLEDGKVVGIEVEIMEIICQKLGVELVLEQIQFDSVLPGVKAGKYDCGMSGISVTPKRAKSVLFTDAYCLAAQCIVVKADSTISTKADLEGKKISVQSGTTAEDYCLAEGYAVSSFEHNNEAKIALGDKVDAWVVDDLTAAEMCKGDSSVKILSEHMTTEPYAFAFTFGSEDLVEEINKIIAELIADGTVASLFEKYDAPYTAPEND